MQLHKGTVVNVHVRRRIVGMPKSKGVASSKGVTAVVADSTSGGAILQVARQMMTLLYSTGSRLD